MVKKCGRMNWRRRLFYLYSPSTLRGMLLSDWFSLLRQNRFEVDRAYLLRALSITAFSAVNSALAPLESGLYSKRISQQRVPPPLFILCFARSGTTHLFQLLSRHPHFQYPTTIAANFPHIFLCTEALLATILSPLAQGKRIQDGVGVAVDSPEEDELAHMQTTRMSPLLSALFPKGAHHYHPYRTFESATPEERARWKERVFHFFQKLTLRDSRPLLLKSPGHLARLGLLLEMFPNARFVHLRRHPYDVIRSQHHTRGQIAHHWGLQRAPAERDYEWSLELMEESSRRFLEERPLIVERLYEMRYEDLIRRPEVELRRMHEALELPGYDEFLPLVKDDLRKPKPHSVRHHDPLPDSVKAEANNRLREWISFYGWREEEGRRLPEPNA